MARVQRRRAQAAALRAVPPGGVSGRGVALLLRGRHALGQPGAQGLGEAPARLSLGHRRQAGLVHRRVSISNTDSILFRGAFI